MPERGTIPRKIRGFRDIDPRTNELRWRVIAAISDVYRRYGFQHWDTPILEYAECLGKYLPDTDTIEGGVYSFRNPEKEPVLDNDGRELRDEWNRVRMENHFIALRYDLTAPLARKYAEDLWPARVGANAPASPPLFRRYQFGPVFRFEAKLDPGRFREFWQLDFDSVGVSDVICDAEACCVLSDALEAVGLGRGTFEVRVNNRKLHKGLFERVGILDHETTGRDVLRVIDKYDKIGPSGIAAELGGGRTDEGSGARIPGLGLPPDTIRVILDYVESCVGIVGRQAILSALASRLADTPSGREGVEELRRIDATLASLGYGDDRVIFDPSVARGLTYYTGPVFEAVAKLEYRDAQGVVRRFGTLAGGGRFDDLVERLLGIRVPATGASIGVDRLVELLIHVSAGQSATGPVIVLVLDQDHILEYLRMAGELRTAGIPTEVYYGLQRRMKAQLAYADAKGCPVAVIAGGTEFAKGTVSLKNLRLGKTLSPTITSRDDWLAAHPAQTEIPRGELVPAVQRLLAESGC